MRITATSGKITTLGEILPPLASSSLLLRLHEALGAEYQLLVQGDFEAEASPEGAPWQPLARATVKRRGSAHPILRVTGRLARTHLQATADEVIVGSNLPYAAIHQYGGVIQRKGGEVKLHFKKFKSGPRKGKVLFSRPKEATFGMKANVGPYTIRIPARPWLFEADGSIPAHWMRRLEQQLISFIGARHA